MVFAYGSKVITRHDNILRLNEPLAVGIVAAVDIGGNGLQGLLAVNEIVKSVVITTCREFMFAEGFLETIGDDRRGRRARVGGNASYRQRISTRCLDDIHVLAVAVGDCRSIVGACPHGYGPGIDDAVGNVDARIVRRIGFFDSVDGGIHKIVSDCTAFRNDFLTTDVIGGGVNVRAVVNDERILETDLAAVFFCLYEVASGISPAKTDGRAADAAGGGRYLTAVDNH